MDAADGARDTALVLAVAGGGHRGGHGDAAGLGTNSRKNAHSARCHNALEMPVLSAGGGGGLPAISVLPRVAPPGDMYVTRSVGLVGLLKLWFDCSSLSYLPNQTTRRLYSHSAARPPHHGNGSVVSLSSVTRPCSPEPFPPRARESSAHAARLDLKRELSRPRTASTQLCVRLPARVDARPPRTTPDHPARPVPSG